MPDQRLGIIDLEGISLGTGTVQLRGRMH